MDTKSRALLIIVSASLLIGWSFYKTMGGIDGMRRDPQQALFVGVFAILVMIPVFWFQLRKLERETPRIPAPDPEPGAPADARLTSMPHVVVASRPKLTGLLVILIVAAPVVVWAMDEQPGVCRAIGLAAVVPFFTLGIAMAIAGILWPERLEIAPWGLKHISFWRTRQWPWDEVRNITTMRSQKYGASWASGITFNRYVSQSSEPGAAHPTFRPIWSLPADEVARLLNEARTRWSHPATAAGLTPAHRRLADYLFLGLTYAVVGTMFLLIMTRPCGW